MTDYISLVMHKGGVGKTTTATNIAAIAARILGPDRVLLIDLDPQSNATSTYLGPKLAYGTPEANQNTLFEVLQGQAEITEAIYPVDLPKKGEWDASRFHLVPFRLRAATLDSKLNTSQGTYTLTDALEPIDGMYDLVLIDCPPAIGGFWANALAISTGIVIPLVPGPYEGESLKNLIDLLPGYRRVNENIDVLGVILTRSKLNTRMYKETRSAIVNAYGEEIMFPPIQDRVLIPEATSHRQDIFTYDPKSPSAKEYVAATQNLLQRLGYYDELGSQHS